MESKEQIVQELLKVKVNLSSRNFKTPSSVILDSTLSNPVENKIKKYLLKAENITDYYTSIHSSIGANPSKKGVVKASNAVYIKYANIETERNNIINTKDGLLNIWSLLTRNNKTEIIFIKATRGTGKTTLLNNLINNYTRRLEKEKMIWFRIDVTKIYEEWRSLDEDNQYEISLSDYLAIQIPFVAIKYKDKSPAFETIINEVKGKNPIRQLIQKSNIYKQNFTKSHVRDVLFDKKEKCFKHFASETILKAANDCGYKVCVVIDGMDNIDFSYDYKSYKKFITQFVRIFQSGRKQPLISKFVVALRRETYIHLRKRKPELFNRNTYKCFDMIPAPATEVLEKKAKVARVPVPFFEKNKNEELINQELLSLKDDSFFKEFNTFKKFDDSFVDYSKKYTGRLINTLNKYLPSGKQFNSHLDIMDFVTNENMRDYIINFINSYRSWLLFERKKGKHVPESSRILESLILNGRIYLDSPSSNSDQSMGYLIPNILWFNVNKVDGVWHGLCGLRILQYLCSSQDPSKNKLISNLQDDFSYKTEIIEERIYTFMKFGLIAFKDTNYKDKEHSFKITRKGTLMRSFLFFNTDIFYIFSLDTPLVSSIDNNTYFEFNSSEVSFHYVTNNNLWNDYLVSSIKTSLTLIRHMMTHNNNEMQNIESSHKIDCYNLSLDHFNNVISGIYSKMNSLSKQKNDAFNDLLIDLKGIYNPSDV